MTQKNPSPSITPVHIIGGGLAGCEAAWQLVHRQVPVILHEMRPKRMTEAHQTHDLAELVCSNSFRSDDSDSNAVGLLHEEMRRMGSLIMQCADHNQVPAGGALAVDRIGFAQSVTEKITSHPLVTVDRNEIAGPPDPSWDKVIIATGPLTSPALAQAILQVTDQAALAFYDAIAPIVYRESINMDVAWFQSRYDKVGPGGNGADYINCPMDQEQYNRFVDALLSGDKTEFRDFEKTPYFDGCLPIEVMAERGRETLRQRLIVSGEDHDGIVSDMEANVFDVRRRAVRSLTIVQGPRCTGDRCEPIAKQANAVAGSLHAYRHRGQRMLRSERAGDRRHHR